MQKAPVMKGSGLKPLDDGKPNEEIHVFGKNLEERVVTNDDREESPSISFSSLPNSLHNSQNAEDDIDSIRKRKFDAITGEEDEETVFQGDFKLFVWDLTTSNWIEKGRGQLKLNDSVDQDKKKTRLIMRVSGTLRIILNVAVNRSYFRVIANSKNNIRFTDSQTVWAASGSNAHQLKDLIEERLGSMSADEEVEIRKKSKPETETKQDLQSRRVSDEVKEVEEVKAVDGVKEVEEVKEVKEVNEIKEIKENKEIKEVKEVDEVRDVKEVKEDEGVEDIEKVEEVKEVEDTEDRDSKEVKEDVEDRDAREVKEDRDDEEGRDDKEVRDHKEVKEDEEGR